MSEIKRVSIERIDGTGVQGLMTQLRGARKPAIVSCITNTWPAFARWTPDYFKTTYGDLRIAPTIHAPSSESPYAGPLSERVWSNYVREMTLREFVDYLYTTDKPCYFHSQNMDRIPGTKDDLKFDRLFPDDIGDSESYFWLGINTLTGLHFDLRDNILCQFYGEKDVYLISPVYSNRLYPLPASITKSPVLPMRPDQTAYPRLQDITIQEGTIRPGEFLFIPRRWWHCIVARGISISANHWFGEKVGYGGMLAAVNAGGLRHWLAVGRDFTWHGLMGRPFVTRLYEDPPFGKLLYDMVSLAVGRRLSVAKRRRS
jgi:hypothetical protein